MKNAFQTPYDAIDFSSAEWAPTIANYPTLKALWSGRQAAGAKFLDSINGNDITITTTKDTDAKACILPVTNAAVVAGTLASPGAAGSAKSFLFIAVGEFTTGSLVLGGTAANGVSTGRSASVGKVIGDGTISKPLGGTGLPTNASNTARAVLIQVGNGATPVAGNFGMIYGLECADTTNATYGSVDVTAATALTGLTAIAQTFTVGTAAQKVHAMGTFMFNSTPSLEFIKAMLAWTNWSWRTQNTLGIYPALKGVS